MIEPAYWSFMLGGLVKKPVVLSYDDLLSSPPLERASVLMCAGSQLGEPLMASVRWTGVPLRDLLAEAEISSKAAHAHLYAVDGYATSIELSWARNALLAYRLNGEPLAREHGGPVRLVVPGLYGYKMPKWIQRILLADAPLQGVWERRGWPQVGVVQTTTAIAKPRHLERVPWEPMYFTGAAYAGLRRVVRVEISVENGPWAPVNLLHGPPGTWTRWYALWAPPAPGDYCVSARAIDETGAAQPNFGQSSPSGAGVAHTIVVRVVS
ncbi:MAG: molybdopterin-dependent oxidoreductase [Aggregatilineales bacterium]